MAGINLLRESAPIGRDSSRDLEAGWKERMAQVDAIATHRNAFLNQELPLSPSLRETPVGADHAMPGEAFRSGGKNAADQPGRLRVDVTVSAHKSNRNRAHPAQNARGARVEAVALRWHCLEEFWRDGSMNEMSQRQRFELGYPRTELRRKLVAAVLSGDKTATASLLSDYEPTTSEPLPVVGQQYLLVGYDDEPIAIVETTEVRIVPCDEVDVQFARDEGEGFESVADWLAAHERFWDGQVITHETPIVCERFRLVQRLEAVPPASNG